MPPLYEVERGIKGGEYMKEKTEKKRVLSYLALSEPC
jgi:hypothetical protein